ncbi:Histo-blood group ABO system transferase 1 [Lemmus lemmus]
MAGVKVALVAMHHAYIVTERIEGIQNMPNVRDHDASVYLRLQGDALSVGGYEANPIFWEEVSDKFAFGLFDLDWDVFTQHIEGAINRVPVLEKTGIKSTVCGPGRPKCYSLHLGILPLTMFILVFFGMVYDQPKALTPSRNDVLVMTPWLAPIIWEGTFNTDILNEQFRLQNTTIGLTMFAIKKYVVFLKLFLETAEQHFMVGHKVIYYVFTDRPAEVPQVPLGAGRKLVVLTVRNYSRWQDVSMHRMEMISHFSERRFLHEVDYLVCADVDMKFQDHVGVEILSALFGTLHPGFYRSSREAFTYERRPKSRAYIPRDEGDFYYAGGFFGGSVVEVHHLTKACHQAMVEDKANGIEAVWHDESYLNKYLLYHKPTKVLSPEYVWDQKLLGWPSIMKKLRYVAVPKNHQAIRNR